METEIFSQDIKKEDVESLTEDSFCMDVMSICNIVKDEAKRLAEMLAPFKGAVAAGGLSVKVELVDPFGEKLVYADIGFVKAEEKKPEGKVFLFKEDK